MKRIEVYIIIAMLFLLFSCATQMETARKIDAVKKEVIDENGALGVSYIPESELKYRFGDINNPFVSPVSFLKSNKLMVFELGIRNNSINDFLLRVSKIELVSDGIKYNPLNRFQLAGFWEPRIKKQSQYKKWNMSVMKKVIKENVFDNKVTVKSGDFVSGLLVFQGDISEYGRLVMYIPLFRLNGEILKVYKVIIREGQ